MLIVLIALSLGIVWWGEWNGAFEVVIAFWVFVGVQWLTSGDTRLRARFFRWNSYLSSIIIYEVVKNWKVLGVVSVIWVVFWVVTVWVAVYHWYCDGDETSIFDRPGLVRIIWYGWFRNSHKLSDEENELRKAIIMRVICFTCVVCPLVFWLFC